MDSECLSWLNLTSEDLNNAAVRAIQKAYYSNYEVVFEHKLEVGSKRLLRDPVEQRTCRFCGKFEPEVSFKNDAHAVSHFLGNNTLFTANECDECNGILAQKYEDHLAKWSVLTRAITGVKGKRGRPTFKSTSVRVEPSSSGLHITYSGANNILPAAEDFPFEFELGGDLRMQSHVPLYAAMALVRMAINVCPYSELHECKNAIQWIRGDWSMSMTGLRVMYAFTPGTVPANASHVLLLRRTKLVPSPYLWFIIQFRNTRLQMFVPFCNSDQNWLHLDKPSQFSYVAFPSNFPKDWEFGETKFGFLDWSSKEVKSEQTGATIRMVGPPVGEDSEPRS